MKLKFYNRYRLLAFIWIILLIISIKPTYNFIKNEIRKYERIQYQNYCKSLFKDDFVIDNDSEGSDHPDEAFQQDFLMTMDPKIKRIPHEALFDAIKAAEISRQTENITIDWKERGPKNIGGRTRAIMIDPNDPDKKRLWAGCVSGGLWVNLDITDPDEEWGKIDDFWDNLAITSICYDPTYSFNFYVGTGEGWVNIDAVHGGGIWKSSNGGVTWSLLANTHNNRDFDYVQKIVVHPQTGDIYAGTKSWDSANRGGVLRSTDGGLTWDRVLCTTSLPTSSITNRCADIEFTHDNSIVVSMGIGNTDGIYISNTGNVGDWTPINNGIPANRRRIELATAPADADIIYAAIEDDVDSLLGVFKTTDKGLNWSQVATPMRPNGTEIYTGHQAWYDLIIAVHPTNSNYVYTGGKTLARSFSGGSSWEAVVGIHSDYHNIIFRPGNPNDVIFSCDGGVYYTDNGWGAQFNIYDRNSRYITTQYYSVAMHPQSSLNYFLGGTQDNGTLKLQTSGYIEDATFAVHGDGGFCFIDNNSKYQFATYVHNKIYRSTNYGEDWYRIVDDGTGRFINPFDYDQKEKILYSASDEFSIKMLRDATNISYSEDLISGQNFGAIASHIKVSPYEDNTIYVGVNGGRLFKIEDANQPNPITSELTWAGFPDGYFSCIEFGESENQMLVTFSNYSVTSVFESTDGGSTFLSKEGDLPDMPVRWALYNPINLSQVLLATEVGVWSTEDIRVANPHWVASNSSLANVRVDMLKTRGSDNLVVAATHGRGMYTASAFEFLKAEKILPNDGQMNDHFGRSVSMSGVYAIIGSANDFGTVENCGAAYIFTRLGINEWQQSQKLVPLQPGEGDNFGCSVSIHGDYAVVGAMYDEEKGSDAGAAYIFQNQSGNWVQKQKLLASDGDVFHRFGAFVSIFGDYVDIGAPGSDGNETRSGAVYIFKKDGENWVENKKIIAFDGKQDDAFCVVNINGTHIAVGAPNHGFALLPRSGAVYMFELIAGEWQAREMLRHEEALEGDMFGWSVSIFDEKLIVGAFAENTGVVESGAAYIYEKDGDFWQEVKKLSPGNPLEHQYFGRSVSIFDEYAVVGVEGDWVHGLGSGSAYIYQNRDNDWFRQNKIVPQDGEANDIFGSSVQIYNDIVLIGAEWDDDNGDYAGSVYAFTNFTNVNNQGILYVNTNNLTIPASGGIYTIVVDNNGTGLMDWVSSVDQNWITIIEGTSGTNSGTIKLSIDQNDYCERKNELIVLAPSALNSPQLISVVQETGPGPNEVKIIANDPDASDYFGYSVDVDGNYAIVGANRDDEFGSDAGAAYIFERDGCCSWIQKAKLRKSGASATDHLGESVAISGNVAIVGTSTRSKVFVYEKPIGGWQDMTETAVLAPADGAPNQYFGHSIDISGENVIVGAPLSKKIFIYQRPEGGWHSMSESFSYYSPSSGYNSFGKSVAIYKNYAVVGSLKDGAVNPPGRVYVFKYIWDWVLQAELIPNDSQINDHFGSSVDIDANRIIVGAENTEAAYIFVRENDMWIEEQKLTGGTAFGFALGYECVSIDGDYALVGAKQSSDSSNIRTGSAISFVRKDGGWSFSKQIFSTEHEQIAEFGGAVSTSGAHTIISADHSTLNNVWYAGAAYIYCTKGDIVTSVSTPNQDQTLPVSYDLKQNYPNPFNPATTIVFDLPKPTNVTLKIYTILGEEVTTLVSEELKSGTHKYSWNPVSLASGVYLYRIESKEFTLTKKMVHLK